MLNQGNYMTPTTHASMASPLPFSFKAQCVGIIASVIIHVAVILLLFLTPVTKMIPNLQIIQVSLEQHETLSSDIPKKTEQIIVSKISQAQNKISPKTLLNQLPVQKEVIQEHAASEQQGTITPALPAEEPVIAPSSKLEITGSANDETQSDTKIRASMTSKTDGRDTAETQFGYIGAPTFIHREMPVYPMLARRLGKEGKVILKLLIDMNGNLQNVEIVEPAGFGFTEAAVAAVKNSTYAPANRNGEKVTTTALLPVRFYLQ
jgi:periplasmic protein TonB